MVDTSPEEAIVDMDVEEPTLGGRLEDEPSLAR